MSIASILDELISAVSDPEPWRRCCCTSSMADDSWHDPFAHRCPFDATAEDGLCDHCRQPDGCCTDPDCIDPDGERGVGCCLQPYARRTFVDLHEPCRRGERAAKSPKPSEVDGAS